MSAARDYLSELNEYTGRLLNPDFESVNAFSKNDLPFEKNTLDDLIVRLGVDTVIKHIATKLAEYNASKSNESHSSRNIVNPETTQDRLIKRTLEDAGLFNRVKAESTRQIYTTSELPPM